MDTLAEDTRSSCLAVEYLEYFAGNMIFNGIGIFLDVFSIESLAVTCKVLFKAVLRSTNILQSVLSTILTELKTMTGWDNGGGWISKKNKTTHIKPKYRSDSLVLLEKAAKYFPKHGKGLDLLSISLSAKNWLRRAYLLTGHKPTWLLAIYNDPRAHFSDKVKRFLRTIHQEVQVKGSRHKTCGYWRLDKEFKSTSRWQSVATTTLEAKVNSVRMETKDLLKNCINVKTYTGNLINIHTLLVGTHSAQQSLVTADNDKTLSNPKIHIKSAVSETGFVVPGLMIELMPACRPREMPSVYVYTKSKDPSVHKVTKGLCCIITSDGNILPTTGFWEGQNATIPEFLQYFNDNLWDASGQIGKLTNACIFCGKPLSTGFSLEKGFGEVCRKKWKLDQFYKCAENITTKGNSTTVLYAQDANDITSIAPIQGIQLGTYTASSEHTVSIVKKRLEFDRLVTGQKESSKEGKQTQQPKQQRVSYVGTNETIEEDNIPLSLLIEQRKFQKRRRMV